jgi:ElaB/YqjD/DUF883 family membrane-anchored ribosome-binding protein
MDDVRTNTAGSTGLMDKVRSGANAQLSIQKDRAVEGIGNVAQAVRQSTQHLREQQHDVIARYVDQAAGQLERFSSRLKEKNVGEMLQDAQEFAKRRPALFVGSAFAVGLLGARFLKSSRERQAGYGSTAARSGSPSRGTGYRGGYAGSTPAGSPPIDTGRY